MILTVPSTLEGRPMDRDPRNDDRDDKILAAAVDLAQRFGLAGVTRQAVAAATTPPVAESTVSNYRRWRMSNGEDDRTASAMTLLRDDVMRWAVDHACLTVLRDGLAARHPIALSAPGALRVAALTV